MWSKLGKSLVIFLAMGLFYTPLVEAGKSVSAPLDKNIEEVKDIILKGSEAVNSGDITKILPVITDDFTLITIENLKLSSKAEFQDWWKNVLYGDKHKVKKFTFEPLIDEHAIYISKDLAILQGSAESTYAFINGGERTFHTRWTAILSHQKGQWKIQAMHHSSGLAEGQMADARSQLMKTALGGLLAGLVIGMLLMSLMKRTEK